MRSSLIAIAALSITGCATADTGRVCQPLLSWASPAYRCTGTAPAPAPEPEPEAEAPPPEEPPPPEEKVKVEQDTIEISEKVQFETDSAILKPESEKLLDEVAKAMSDNPDITKVEIQGHTDSRASDSYNRRLSRERALSVRSYLISKGIQGGRLTAKGYGEEQPVAENDTEEGRYQNRRVVFKILKRGK